MRALLFASLLTLSVVPVGCATETEEETPAEDDIQTPKVFCVDAETPCALPSNLDNPAKKFLRDNPRLFELKGGHKNFTTCSGFGEHAYNGDFTTSSARVIDAIATSQPKDVCGRRGAPESLPLARPQKVYARGGRLPPIAVGMVFILSLKLAPLVFIPVAFEIVDLNAATGNFAFSYVVQNKSQGIQMLAFTDTPTGSHVLHETRFKSDSEFRDRNFYIYFHEKLLKEFYGALAKKLATAQ